MGGFAPQAPLLRSSARLFHLVFFCRACPDSIGGLPESQIAILFRRKTSTSEFDRRAFISQTTLFDQKTAFCLPGFYGSASQNPRCHFSKDTHSLEHTQILSEDSQISYFNIFPSGPRPNLPKQQNIKCFAGWLGAVKLQGSTPDMSGCSL